MEVMRATSDFGNPEEGKKHEREKRLVKGNGPWRMEDMINSQQNFVKNMRSDRKTGISSRAAFGINQQGLFDEKVRSRIRVTIKEVVE